MTYKFTDNGPYQIAYIGKSTNADGWQHFAWRVTIDGQEFDYRTGLGLIDKTSGKPSKPKLADVLECLQSDADCGNYSFNEFCDNLGYNNDSLKAFDTYRACMETAGKLSRFSKETKELIQQILRDQQG